MDKHESDDSSNRSNMVGNRTSSSTVATVIGAIAPPLPLPLPIDDIVVDVSSLLQYFVYHL
jgi:hypothetical protein